MNVFRRDKGATPSVPPRPSKEELDHPITHSMNTQDAATAPQKSESTSELNPKAKRTGVMGVMQKVNPFKSAWQNPPAVSKAPSSESLERGTDSTQNPGGLKGVMQKVNPFKSTSQASKAPSTESLEQGSASDSNQNPAMLKGARQKVNPSKSTPQNDPPNDSVAPPETGRDPQGKQNPGMIAGMMQKVNPFKSSQPKDTQSLQSDLSSSSGSLAENNNLPEKQNPGMLRGMMQKVNPFRSQTQKPEEERQTDPVFSTAPSCFEAQEPKIHSDHSSSSDSVDDSEIMRHSIWYVDADASSKVEEQPAEAPKRRTGTFRIRRILPSALFRSGTKDAAAAAAAPDPPQEVVELQMLPLEDVPVPGEGAEDPLEDEDGLLAWWRTVDGWQQWNESVQNDEPEDVIEDAADRVFMAARLFVRFFNQCGASLQKRILDLLALADAADNFHKKTVTASVGGGVASVAGSITTITGLILAPFTAGTSLIVTAVGIGIATAGGVASASANITDTVHSKTDRKKVEKMIQDYEDEIKDIRECLIFLQEGMDMLEEWNFEKYAESISKKHLNQNVKHVMKEGGRAGKALVINTETLIGTIQVLGVAGGAAKAVQVMSITTGVMSGLFLALDVFFLAKDSMELKKGAKTDFAAKIREVCKDLQDGLLELNRIKEELQKTMDGVEVEVDEEEEDVEVLKSELKKLIELEEE
ncbi:uncharacterized protein [Antennarius striatus]|uniref:uncharacterized protein n=1 Tax=Antennarius striatus TaxID=241820 RepID=UPI0035B409A8